MGSHRGSRNPRQPSSFSSSYSFAARKIPRDSKRSGICRNSDFPIPEPPRIHGSKDLNRSDTAKFKFVAARDDSGVYQHIGIRDKAGYPLAFADDKRSRRSRGLIDRKADSSSESAAFVSILDMTPLGCYPSWIGLTPGPETMFIQDGQDGQDACVCRPESRAQAPTSRPSLTYHLPNPVSPAHPVSAECPVPSPPGGVMW